MEEPRAATDAHRCSLQLRALNQALSPLLRLPRELRDEVLTYVVDSLPPRVIIPQGLPATLQASHQLRQEMAEIFYLRKALSCLRGRHRGFATHFDPSHKQYLHEVCIGPDIPCLHWRVASRQAEELDKDYGVKMGTFGVMGRMDPSVLAWFNAYGERLR